jgi:uncharacterized membrane protein
VCCVSVAISLVKEWMYSFIMFLLLKSCLVHSLSKVGIKSVTAVLSTQFDDMAGAKTFSLVGSGINKCNSIAVDAVCVIRVSKHIMGKKHWRIFKELQNQMLLLLTSVKV